MILDAGTIAVWPVRLDDAAGAASLVAHALSSDERSRAARFRFDRDRDAYVAARGVLRVVLAAYLAVAPETIAFAYGPSGKPHLKCASDLRFNLSHSSGLVLASFTAGAELGIDVERVRPLADRDAVAARFFHPDESAELARLPRGARDRAFFTCWTRKEALLKACGTGLSSPLDRFCVSVRPGEPARLLHVDGDRDDAGDWKLEDVALAHNEAREYAAAIAYRGEPRRVIVARTADARSLIAALSS